MTEVSPELKRMLREIAKRKYPEASAEDLKKVLQPLVSMEVEEESVFLRKARIVLAAPVEKKPVKKQAVKPVEKPKLQLSPLDKLAVWFTTRLEQLKQRLVKGHGSKVNADLVDDKHACDIAVEAANLVKAGRGAGVFGASITSHTQLEGVTANQHHTPTASYTDAEAIAAVEGEATLDLTGKVTITGQANNDALILGGTTEEGGDFKVYKDAAGNLCFNIDADLGLATVNHMYPATDNTYKSGSLSAPLARWKAVNTVQLVFSNINSGVTNATINTTTTSATRNIIFSCGDGAVLQNVMKMIGGECQILRGGDITMLDTKKLATSLTDDDYFTIEAVDNDTNALVEVAKVLGAAEPELGISRAGDIIMLTDKYVDARIGEVDLEYDVVTADPWAIPAVPGTIRNGRSWVVYNSTRDETRLYMLANSVWWYVALTKA